jgi:hypothetical protein
MAKINKIVLTSICTLLSVIFSSCGTIKRESIEKYKGGIIYDNKTIYRDYKSFTVRLKGEFRTVHVYDLDYNRYNVGDTIK